MDPFFFFFKAKRPPQIPNRNGFRTSYLYLTILGAFLGMVLVISGVTICVEG